jgi:hypothetical protein
MSGHFWIDFSLGSFCFALLFNVGDALGLLLIATHLKIRIGDVIGLQVWIHWASIDCRIPTLVNEENGLIYKKLKKYKSKVDRGKRDLRRKYSVLYI